MRKRCKQTALWASILICASQTVACSTPEQSRLTGQVVGAAIGIAAGAQFGNGIGTLLVAGHGGWLGFKLGEAAGELWPEDTKNP
jgi:uncharacterized protein YcfJ